MKRIKNQEKIKKTIYSVSALALCAVTLFSFWMSNRENNITPAPSDTTTTTETTTKEVQVNTPVTNVPDDRYTTTTTEADVKINVTFSLPLDNKIIRQYSNGELVKNKTTEDWRTHNGIDISGKKGEKVTAIHSGTVTLLEHSEIWGACLTVNHGNGFTAKYCGLEKGTTAQPGDEIQAGDKIGALGEIPIEKADEVHLHFELYKDDITVSPSDYIGKSFDI